MKQPTPDPSQEGNSEAPPDRPDGYVFSVLPERRRAGFPACRFTGLSCPVNSGGRLESRPNRQARMSAPHNTLNRDSEKLGVGPCADAWSKDVGGFQ